jgi:hypothetical protein
MYIHILSNVKFHAVVMHCNYTLSKYMVGSYILNIRVYAHPSVTISEEGSRSKCLFKSQPKDLIKVLLFTSSNTPSCIQCSVRYVFFNVELRLSPR